MSTQKNSEVYFAHNLGRDVTVRVIHLKQKIFVDIRKWESFASVRRSYPTKKGIALTPQCWARLRQSAKQIEEFLVSTNREEEIKIDIGRGIFVSIPPNKPFIHIREWYMDGEEMKPGRKGICLHYAQWERFVNKFTEIHENLPENARESPCYLDDDHQNQLGALMCRDCNPYAYKEYSDY